MDNRLFIRSRKTIRSLLAFSACGLLLAGCHFDRTNHFNNPDNAARSSKAYGAISGLHDTNQAGVLAAIASDTAFVESNDKTRELINESTFIDTVGNKSWLSLRAKMWRDFGIITPDQQELYDAADDPDKYTERLKSDADTYDQRVNDNIEKRVAKITAIGKVLQTLAEGQAALAKNAAKQAASSLAQLQQMTTNSQVLVTNLALTGTNQVTVADLLTYLDNAIVVAGTQMATNDAIRTKANALQKMILTQVAESRDPASVYALVATVGTGLGTDDLAMLDTFLSTLQASLSNELTKAYIPGTSSPPAQASAPAKKAGAAPASAFSAAERSRPVQTPQNAVQQYIISTFAEPVRFGALPAPRAVQTNVPTSAALGGEPVLTPYEADFFKSYRQTFGLLVRLTNSPLAKAEFYDSDNRMKFSGVGSPPELLEVSLGEIATNLPAAIERLTQAAQDLQVHANGIQDILNDSNVIRAFTTGMALVANGKDMTGTNMLNAVLNVALLDPTLAKYFNQAVPYTNLVKEIAGLARDIASEEVAAGTRLLSYFSELSQSQASLYQENSRHYTVLGAIGTREIQRWNWIGHVFQRTIKLDTKVAPGTDWKDILQTGKPLTASPKLFLDASLIDPFKTFYESRVNQLKRRGPDYVGEWKPAATVPVIYVTDRILPSLQLLSETAKTLHQGVPSSDDPIGLRKEVAFDRLNQAVELLLSSSFAINYNVRQADDLNRLLYSEVAEHDVIVDDIASQTQLAGIRLQAGDSAAFHNTGITDQDIEAVLSALETAAVGYISFK